MQDTKLLEKISENIEQINSRLGNVENRLVNLEKGQEELRGEVHALQKGQDALRKGQDALQKGQEDLWKGQDALREELAKSNRIQTAIKRRLKRVELDISYIAGTFDEEIVRNSKRITRIEEHLQLPPYKN
jgi:hypothetical protein